MALHAAAKDLSRQAKDPMALALWLGIPILIGALITLAFGDVGEAPPRAKLLVADEDGSFLSELFVGLLAREELRVLDSERVPLDEGRKRLDEGEASALLLIPEGFGQAVLEDTPSELELVTNPAQSILPQIAEETLRVLVDVVFYMQRIVGDDIRGIVDEMGGLEATPSDEEVTRISVAVNGVFRRVERYLLPPVLEADTATDAQAPSVDVSVLFLPGIVLMALLFFATGLSEDMWRERSMGTLRRAVSAPGGVGGLFAGKLMAGVVIAGVLALVLMAIGTFYLDLPWRVLPVAVVWCAVTGGVLLVLMCWIQMATRTPRAGQILTNAIAFPLLMVGGSFFPAEMMPKGLAAVGRFTPNGWSVAQLKDLLLERTAPTELLVPLLGMLAVGLLLFALASRTLSKRFARAS
ncbi:MAG: ABC transporter permease [Planctomycetota bacterium]|nr:ABC transporter permease [Planctomycetota bacterium]